MTILSAPPGNVRSTGGRFAVTLENTGNADFVLNLGMMLANGKVMWPSAIHLFLTGAGGTTRELRFKEGGVAGRVDDFVVPMRSGSSYTLNIGLDDYASIAPLEYPVKLHTGTYQLTARFYGRRAQANIGGDMAGVSLLNFWEGEVESNALHFDISQ